MTYIITGDSGQVQRVTDTTDGSPGAALNCGDRHVLKGEASNGQAGDSARWYGVSGDASAVLVNGGDVEFTPIASAVRLDIQGQQRGIFEVRASDNLANGAFLFQANGTADLIDNTAFHTTGPTQWFESSVNGTNNTIGTGANLDVKYHIRMAGPSDLDFNGYGTYVLVDFTRTVYDDPVVRLDGVTLQNIKGSLPPREAAAYAAYEVVYKFERSMLSSPNTDIGFSIKAKDNQNPTNGADDISVDFAAIEGFRSLTDLNEVLRGSVDDTSSLTTVITLESTLLAVA